MKKIEQVISDCTKCRYSKEYQEVNGNTSFILICNRHDADDENVDLKIYVPFLLNQSHNKIKGYDNIPIPPNCPLETYKEPLI